MLHIQDPEKASDLYDKCISASPNGLVYALSWYMNIVCPEWEILATDDYSTVMPLPISRSLGRKVIRQPEYAWQLGVFSTQIPSPEIIRHFVQSIPSAYRLRKLCLNKFNILPSSGARFLNSAELDLIQPYARINSKYGKSMNDRLILAKKESLSYIKNVSVHDMLMFGYRLDKFNRGRLKAGEISILRLLASNAIRFRSGQIGAAYDVHNNLCATVLFALFKGRASILYAAASSEGLAQGGIEFIIDRFIKINTEQNLVLCVDNSSDKKLMEILKGCGSGISNYPCLKNLD